MVDHFDKKAIVCSVNLKYDLIQKISKVVYGPCKKKIKKNSHII